MLLQSLNEVECGFPQQSIGLQRVVAPYFEVHLCVRCYIPARSETHDMRNNLMEAFQSGLQTE